MHVNAKFSHHEAPAYGKISSYRIHHAGNKSTTEKVAIHFGLCVLSSVTHMLVCRALLAQAGCRLLTPVLAYCILNIIAINLVMSITVTRGADLRFIGQSEMGP